MKRYATIRYKQEKKRTHDEKYTEQMAGYTDTLNNVFIFVRSDVFV